MYYQQRENENLRHSTQNDLHAMSFEEIIKLKGQLGAKVYKEVVLGLPESCRGADSDSNKNLTKFKRLSKNHPREVSAKRPVPYLGIDNRGKHKSIFKHRDPRFDERTGTYNVKKFKENYKFLSDLREEEIKKLKQQLNCSINLKEKQELKKLILKLVNKNVEEKNWHRKQKALLEEKASIEKTRAEGKQPYYITKRERHIKELVAQFQELKTKGKLAKHLEKRRKKIATKDRKKMEL